MAKKVSLTHELAYYLWTNIQEKDTQPYSDPIFVRRYLSMAKKVLKAGADIVVVKKAMDIMKRQGIDVYSPQQTIDWSDRKTGQSFYELAQLEIARQDIQPPIYNAIAYAEWMLERGRGDELKDLL